MMGSQKCPICGSREFSVNKILWPELIGAWELSPYEVEYVNRQQGVCCATCGNNLRSMALAYAILQRYQFHGVFTEFVVSDLAKSLSVLEINEAGGLGGLLRKMPNHQLACYPEHDMTKLSFASLQFDMVFHSDTLEHVHDPIAGLSECCRILKLTGACIFTVPLIVGRLTRSRTGLKNSYHGKEGHVNSDYIVRTEFGADVWKYAIEAGFGNIRIHSFEYPAALAIEATK